MTYGTTTKPNIQITGVPEGEEREKGKESLFKEIWVRTSQAREDICTSKFMKLTDHPISIQNNLPQDSL